MLKLKVSSFLQMYFTVGVIFSVMLGQHCELLPHSKKVFGLIPVSSRYSGIFPQSRDLQDGLLGYSNLAIGVNGCLSLCVSL